MGCFSIISEEVFFYVEVAAGGLGLIGASGIIFVFFRYPLVRTYSNRLILNLALAQAISSLTFFVPISVLEVEIFCKIVAIVFNSMQIVTIFWAFSIVFTLYTLIGKPLNSYAKSYKYWVLVGWVLIPLVNIVPLLTNSYSSPNKENNYTCTYKVEDLVSEIWRISLFFLPAWTFIIISSVLYWKVYKKVTELRLEGESKEFINRLFFYPLILLGIMVPMSILRIYDLFQTDCVTPTMIQFVDVLLGVQGLFDGIVFFRTPSVLSCLRKNEEEGRRRKSDGRFLSEFTSSMTSGEGYD